MPAVMRPPPRKAQPVPAAARSQVRGGGAPSTKVAGKPEKPRTPYAPGKLAGAGAHGLPPRAVGLAVAAVLIGGVALTLATGGRAQAVASTIGLGADRSFAGLGFRIGHVRLNGASPFAEPYILRATGLSAGDPMLGLNLSQLRDRIEAVGYVKSAKVVRLLPDTLAISVVERPRLAVWQHDGAVNVVDDQGQVIPEADAGLFSDLPLVVGEGANETAASILPLVQARPRLMHKLEALVRVDARRWDLRLKDGSLVQLPAIGEDAALIQLDQLDQRARLLELGFERIDLRDAEMVAVRPRAAPGAPQATAPMAAAPQPPAAVL